MRRRSYLVACLIIHASARAPKFEPYANNHGSAAAAAGADFVYLASDAQHVAGMTIASCQERQRGLTPRTRLAAGGCRADCDALARDLVVEAARYEFAARREPDCRVLAQALARLLHGRRRFPYFAQPVLAGLDRDGVGRCFAFDSVGSASEACVVAAGAARGCSCPSSTRGRRRARRAGAAYPRFASADDARAALVAAFRAAARRDSTVGGVLDLTLVTATAPSGSAWRCSATTWPPPPRRRSVAAPPPRCGGTGHIRPLVVNFVCSSRPDEFGGASLLDVYLLVTELRGTRRNEKEEGKTECRGTAELISSISGRVGELRVLPPPGVRPELGERQPLSGVRREHSLQEVLRVLGNMGNPVLEK